MEDFVRRLKRYLGAELVGVLRLREGKKDFFMVIVKAETPGKKVKDTLVIEERFSRPHSTYSVSDIWDAFAKENLEVVDGMRVSKVLYDSGTIGVVKEVLAFSALVQEKLFDYVFSVILVGSVVRGTATKKSDIDVAVVVNDSDVEKAERKELRDRLCAIFGAVAKEVSDRLSVQVYLLTEFWQSIREANPVIFTFIRDGVPIFDRGLFRPWKALLRTGRIKPSAEAVDRMLLSGEFFVRKVEKTLTDLVIEDLYYSMLNPAQAALMLEGVAPPSYKETPILMRKVFVRKGLFPGRYVCWLSEIIRFRKGVEHGKIKSVSGRVLEKHLRRSRDYLRRIDELFVDIKKRKFGEELESLDRVCREYIGHAFVAMNKKPPKRRVFERFKTEIVDKELLKEDAWNSVKYLSVVKRDYKRGRLTSEELRKAQLEVREFVRDLILFIKAQRFGRVAERVKFLHGRKVGQLVIYGNRVFIVGNLADPGERLLVADMKRDGALTNIREASLKSYKELESRVLFSRLNVLKNSTINSLEKLFKKIEIIIED